MNCKQGDLAVVVRTYNHPWTVGMIVRCKELSPLWCSPHWRTVVDVINPATGGLLVFSDDTLRPIRDQPGEDETPSWLPVPAKETS